MDKTLEGLEKNWENQPFLFEILDEVQEKLGVRKQLIVSTYNNNTRNIKFADFVLSVVYLLVLILYYK